MRNRFNSLINIVDKVSKFVPIDLSIRNNEIINRPNNPKEWSELIQNHLDRRGGDIAYGGYLEHRNLYDRSIHFGNNNSDEKRNIHLGIDFWTNQPAEIFAPFDGTIHSFKNNKNFGDYGPTIILEHYNHLGKFYTLYGHLSAASLADKIVGQELKSGERIASLGPPEENGNYAPHLHFQIILDIADYEGDYPGVCAAKELDFYRVNCPDPQKFI